MSSYERKSENPLPDIAEFFEIYPVVGTIEHTLLKMGYPESSLPSLLIRINIDPKFRSELDRFDAQTKHATVTPGLIKADTNAMLLADLRQAYCEGVAMSPDRLPWDVSMLVKSAKRDKDGQWHYTFVDRAALLDKLARLTGAYEQPEGSPGELHLHFDAKDAKL